MKFKDLDIGDVFRTNLMYFQKKTPEQRSTDDNNSIMVNARFLSDDHYEDGKTDNYIGGPSVSISNSRDVEPVGRELRAVTNEKVSL